MIPTITLYLLPTITIFFILELIYSYKEDMHLFSKRDTLNNIALGIGTFFTQAFSKLFIFYSFQFVFRFHFLTLSNSWWVWVLAFLACEFSFYWFHRACHEVNWFWASHVVHHSSEEFNLSVAIRLPWFPQLTGKFLFWIWMPLLGFSPLMILLIIQLQDFYQGFLHTKTINKLPRIIENFFNTPSHHRVHHSSNFEYLDKNHGGVTVLFDKLFGTFMDETKTCAYGLTDKLDSTNLFIIMFHEWIDLYRKAAKSGSLKNAINYFIKAPGWSHDGSSKTVRQMRKINSRLLSVQTMEAKKTRCNPRRSLCGYCPDRASFDKGNNKASKISCTYKFANA
jgi:sterol desaturase/sphingolipid hydroxylase (fatty acid hydroxylase superfamily)